MIKRTLIFMTICLFSVSIFSRVEREDDLEDAETLRQIQALEDTPLFQAVLNQDIRTFKVELERLDFNELLSTIEAQTASGDTLIDTMARISELNLLKTVQAQTNSGETLLDQMRRNPELHPNQLTLQMQLLVKRLLELGLENDPSIRSLYNYIDAYNNHAFWSIIRDGGTSYNPYDSQISSYKKLFYNPTKELLSRVEKWERIQSRLQNTLAIVPNAMVLYLLGIVYFIITGNPEISENSKAALIGGGAGLLFPAMMYTSLIGDSVGRKLGAKLCKNMFLKKL